MSKSDRNNPKRAASSESRYTFTEFDRDFPDDAACLDWLVGHLYPDGIFCPKCERVTKHHRVKTRTCYACQFCGHQEYPMRGTIFEDSATSLRLWFHGFFLMAQTRCGISAKQLERELGVTYKTAWRMFKKIRSLLEDDGDQFSGTVEIDEAYIGGVARWKKKGQPVARGTADKTIVLGMAQRGSGSNHGRVKVSVIPYVTHGRIAQDVKEKVLPETTVYTDEFRSYDHLGRIGYQHGRVHHKQRVYVSGNVHTNTIEGFWSLVKRGIAGVYHGVSTKHLQSYLDEYA
ncbi:MAG: IS1595 family transposase, partial [Actinobacteria bacterium]|nr:IS1595 family transposase [Actinomycetota bacterium]